MKASEFAAQQQQVINILPWAGRESTDAFNMQGYARATVLLWFRLTRPLDVRIRAFATDNGTPEHRTLIPATVGPVRDLNGEEWGAPTHTSEVEQKVIAVDIDAKALPEGQSFARVVVLEDPPEVRRSMLESAIVILSPA